MVAGDDVVIVDIGAVVCVVPGDDVGVGAAVDVVLLFLASLLWLQNSK